MFGEIPHNFAIRGIERMNKAFSNAQGDHGNTVGGVDAPTGVFVLVVELDVFDAIGLEAGNWISFEIEGILFMFMPL
jgi:hypothetical protein